MTRFVRQQWVARTCVAATLVAGAMPVIGLDAQRPVAAADGMRAADTAAVMHQQVTITLDHVSLKQAVKAVARQANIVIQYRGNQLDAIPHPVTLHAVAMPLSMALESILQGTGLSAVPVTRDAVTIVASETVRHPAVTGGIAGMVVDAQTQQPLHGVTVTLDDALRGVATDAQGAFRLNDISAEAHRLTVRMLGYVRQATTVVVGEGQLVSITFRLSRSVNTLDQVVVTGTIIPTELKAVPNAMTVITAKQIEERGITKINQLFRGDIPGVFAPNGGSGVAGFTNPLGQVIMFSRGATSLSNFNTTTSRPTGYTNPIKTYVDGVELADPSYLSQIDPKSIERIEILTGPQASTIYGSNAINGVMQIFTKRGNTNTPQWTANLMSGFVQNNFSTALTSQHDDALQVSGVEGRWSYDARGSWNFIGAWTPGLRTQRMGAGGGGRMQLGALVGDVTYRHDVTRNVARGASEQGMISREDTGEWIITSSAPRRTPPQTSTLDGQTMGLTLNYTLFERWSHELLMGSDVSQPNTLYTGARYQAPFDSLLGMTLGANTRTSYRYSTTTRVPLGSAVSAVVTAGADAWRSLFMSTQASPTALTGSINGISSVSRLADHNTGAFAQGQLGVSDALFLTYGLRAEWNPSYGADATPNWAPRYGVAYTHDFGGVTAKLRASYGRSTRPPTRGQKSSITASAAGYSATSIRLYGNFLATLANPDLLPENQQGGEGGLELYMGTHGSLVITRYNQTVNDLIISVNMDSARSLQPLDPSEFRFNAKDSAGYGYFWQARYLNVGSIRNQGWELQGSLNTGPFTTQGTYSWTKSRMLGVTPKFHMQFPAADYPQYQPGSRFNNLPDHTWAMTITYGQVANTVSLSLNGAGLMYMSGDALFFAIQQSRLDPQKPRKGVPNYYQATRRGYVLADMNANHQFSPRLTGVLQIKNLTDNYSNDFSAINASIGRQLMTGFRWHW